MSLDGGRGEGRGKGKGEGRGGEGEGSLRRTTMARIMFDLTWTPSVPRN